MKRARVHCCPHPVLYWCCWISEGCCCLGEEAPQHCASRQRGVLIFVCYFLFVCLESLVNEIQPEGNCVNHNRIIFILETGLWVILNTLYFCRIKCEVLTSFQWSAVHIMISRVRFRPLKRCHKRHITFLKEVDATFFFTPSRFLYMLILVYHPFSLFPSWCLKTLHFCSFFYPLLLTLPVFHPSTLFLLTSPAGQGCALQTGC